MRIAMTLLALTLAVGPACKKKEETAPAKETGSAATMGSATGSGSAAAGSAAGSGSAAAGSAAGSGSDTGSAAAGSAAGSGSDTGAAAGSAGSAEAQAMAHHAGNCPSTVFGSTTTAAVKGKEVVVTISSDDKDAIAAIQKRTDEMLKARMEKHPAGEAHDQRGTHGGSIGICPLHIPEGATAKAKHDKKGVVVTITPKDKVDDLKAVIDSRITKAADWVKANIKPGDEGTTGGVGGGKGDDGMNHSGKGDGKGKDRKKGDGAGGGKGTGGGGGKGTGGGTSKKG